MNAAEFVDGRNAVVFEHMVVEPAVAARISGLIADPLDDALRTAVAATLRSMVQEKIQKYGAPGLNSRIKLIYLFLTEGMQGIASGQSLGDQHEAMIKQVFAATPVPAGFPAMKVIGVSELRPIFAQVEAQFPGVRVVEFLLKQDGRGGYDTPKFAAALIQLARRDYQRQELFLRVDEDVQPTADGIRALQETYCQLKLDAANKHFCLSWNYETTTLEQAAEASAEPYEALFDHLVNSYSIRTTFLAESSVCSHFEPETGRLQAASPRTTPCRLNLIHAKYFVDLFKQGKWGSNLDDPISGAGICFSPDSLVDLPPWCNADDLITWIDDFVKARLMALHYGERFERSKGMLRSSGAPGFAQTRNAPQRFTVGDVEWSTTTYLDRLLMGCILSYWLEPERYGGAGPGFGVLLREQAHLTALNRWRGALANGLRAAATTHLRNVLQDWHHFFCAKAAESKPGCIANPPAPPTGFAPAPAMTFFNAYTLSQILAIEEGKSSLVDRVLHVMGRYLQLKYRFWPHIVATIDSLRIRRRRPAVPDQLPAGAADWLFIGLDELGAPESPVPNRASQASIALIARPGTETEPQWLLQWNRKWQHMTLIGGHREAQDPNDLVCMMRELHEELFDGLPGDALARMAECLAPAQEYPSPEAHWNDPYIAAVRKSRIPPHEFPPYVALSTSTGQWSRYEFKIYRVELTPAGLARLFRRDVFHAYTLADKPEGPNEWASRSDIQRGETQLGRPISDTVRQLAREL